MKTTTYTLNDLNRSLTGQGFHGWYLNCEWYGLIESRIEPELSLILFRRESSDQNFGTTYTLRWQPSQLDFSFDVPKNTYKPQLQGELLIIKLIGSDAIYLQQEGFSPLSRNSIKAYFDEAYQTTVPASVVGEKRAKALRHLIAPMIAREVHERQEMRPPALKLK